MAVLIGRLIEQLVKNLAVMHRGIRHRVVAHQQRRDLLEILEDRYERRSTLVTSQFPVDRWHELMGDPALADAILDRLVHNAYRVQLKGESMRKRKQRLTGDEADNP